MNATIGTATLSQDEGDTTPIVATATVTQYGKPCSLGRAPSCASRGRKRQSTPVNIDMIEVPSWQSYGLPSDNSPFDRGRDERPLGVTIHMPASPLDQREAAAPRC